MKKTPLETLNTRQIALPNKWAAKIVRVLLKLMQFRKDVAYQYAFDVGEMKGKPIILLAAHATKDAYKYVLHGCTFCDPNVVIG